MQAQSLLKFMCALKAVINVNYTDKKKTHSQYDKRIEDFTYTQQQQKN